MRWTVALGVAAAISASIGLTVAGQTAAVSIDAASIGGVVTGPHGPEAGVWVIAETTGLGTKFAKIVVTDDRGRYLLPDLPKATYTVWTRGYGLVDSPKVQSTPGNTLNLTAVAAPTPKAAAEYYPASYWMSMLKLPDKREFPGTGPSGNGISTAMKSQAQWIRQTKTDGCVTCHQIGDKATREIPKALGTFSSTAAAWDQRVQAGQAGGEMAARIFAFGKTRALAMFADWTDRIAAGELPPSPPRPQGIERNLVVTMWDWADPKAYLHDAISTDRRNPRVNANGPIYGSTELSSDYLAFLDPKQHMSRQLPIGVRDPKTPPDAPPSLKPSPYWGSEGIWTGHTNGHNPMLDELGRVWMTTSIRPPQNLAYCTDGSIPSSKLFPNAQSGRQVAFWDPRTQKETLIDTCFTTHHLVFARDANRTLWLSSGGPGEVIGWLNTKLFDETHDEKRSQGWTAVILDTNGNGRRDAYTEPNQPIDPTKDHRLALSPYGIAVSPVDGSVWGSVLGFPGGVLRLNPGSNPPETTLAEWYELPWGNPKAAVQGFSPRGLDVDGNGVVWVPLSSGHLASFDRRKCAVLNGPTATGQHCPEGWTLYALPAPQFKGLTDSGSAESPYYDWVDQFDTFGLGRNTPFVTGNQSDALFALVNGKFVTLRVPYPMGFYVKGVDGRFDDPNGGWKGKGLWTTYGTRTPFHVEGGKGTNPKVVHLQLRPDPLAK